MQRRTPEPPSTFTGAYTPLAELFDLTATSWMVDAECATAGVGIAWVPDSPTAEPAALEQAEPLCAVCTVRGRCLDYALEDKSLIGVWGGTTTADRRLIRQAQRAA